MYNMNKKARDRFLAKVIYNTMVLAFSLIAGLATAAIVVFGVHWVFPEVEFNNFLILCMTYMIPAAFGALCVGYKLRCAVYKFLCFIEKKQKNKVGK